MSAGLRLYIRHMSWPIVAAMLGLFAVGVAAISFSQQVTGLAGESARAQLVYGAVAIIVFVMALTVPYRRLGQLAYPLFAITLILLVAVLFTAPVRSTTRWFNLGLFRIQPSEIAKLTYVLMLAWYLRYGDHYRRLRGLIVPFTLAFVPMGLILIQPDLGTSLLFLPTLYFMLFMAGAQLRHLLMILALGAAVIFVPVPREVDGRDFSANRDSFSVTDVGPLRFYGIDSSLPSNKRPEVPLAYFRCQWREGKIYDIQPFSIRAMRPHQSLRISGWLRQGDDRVVVREGFQLRWSLITLASGRWWGAGSDGSQGVSHDDILPIALNQLPHDRTDFVFSLVGGKWGLAGCVAVLLMYVVIFVFGIEIATVTYDPFGRLLAIGVLGLMLSQILINVGMTMGLMPITGMTLPLVSYGGSSLVVNCAALGLLVNVGARRMILLSPHPFEHGRKKEKLTKIESTKDLSERSPKLWR